MPNDLTGDVIEPELGQQVLHELADLNNGFIQLVVSIHRQAESQHQTILEMPVADVAQLARLPAPASRRLTNCAFALFDLRLTDTDFWSAPDNPAKKNKYHRCTFDDRLLQRQVRLFTLSSLMYLRHLASVNRFLAGLCFGAQPDILNEIIAMTLNQLRDVAENCPGLLCCRHGRKPQAWSDLIKLARRNDGQPLLPAKILGYQHAAFE